MTTNSKDASRAWWIALFCYALATVVWIIGIWRAAGQYPGSYDWAYTVISALASRKHNPDGAAWFAGAIVGAMLLLWPVLPQLARAGQAGHPAPRRSAIALRTGVVLAAIVGSERLAFFHFSNIVRKGHELLALLAFLGFYGGIIGLYVHRVRIRAASIIPVILVLAPLIAVGVRELLLYFAQRGVGWADHDWRGAGTPLWLSFALWQWLATVLLWAAIGHLLLTSGPARSAPPDEQP